MDTILTIQNCGFNAGADKKTLDNSGYAHGNSQRGLIKEWLVLGARNVDRDDHNTGIFRNDQSRCLGRVSEMMVIHPKFTNS